MISIKLNVKIETKLTQSSKKAAQRKVADGFDIELEKLWQVVIEFYSIDIDWI